MSEKEIPLAATIKTARYERRPNASRPLNTQLSLTGDDSGTATTFEFHICRSERTFTEVREIITAPPNRARSHHYRVMMELENQEYEELVSFVTQHVQTAKLQAFLSFKVDDYGYGKEPGEYAYVASSLRFVWNFSY